MNVPTVRGGWRCVMSDPPWRYDDVGSRMAPQYKGKGRRYSHYETMALEDIKAIRVVDVVARDAWLFLWAPNSFVLDFQAQQVAIAWGFIPRQLVPWVKIAKNGGLRIGGGHYTRVCSEMLLVCVRGRVKPRDRGVAGALLEPRSVHSRKPDAQYAMIERLCRGPRLEIFARRRWPKWIAVGNQLPQVSA